MRRRSRVGVPDALASVLAAQITRARFSLCLSCVFRRWQVQVLVDVVAGCVSVCALMRKHVFDQRALTGPTLQARQFGGGDDLAR